jgi:hypothetical protein
MNILALPVSPKVSVSNPSYAPDATVQPKRMTPSTGDAFVKWRTGVGLGFPSIANDVETAAIILKEAQEAKIWIPAAETLQTLAKSWIKILVQSHEQLTDETERAMVKNNIKNAQEHIRFARMFLKVDD